MHPHGDITLTRDCDAIQIPSGHHLVLPSGMTVSQGSGESADSTRAGRDVRPAI